MYVQGKNNNGFVYRRLINTSVLLFVNYSAVLRICSTLMADTVTVFVFDPPMKSTIKARYS